jgi:hypothetical protein
MGAIKSPKCSKGHKMTADNVYVRAKGQRECKKCSLARSRKFRETHKWVPKG